MPQSCCRTWSNGHPKDMYDDLRMPRVCLQRSPIWSLIGRTLQSQTTRCFCRDQRAPSLAWHGRLRKSWKSQSHRQLWVSNLVHWSTIYKVYCFANKDWNMYMVWRFTILINTYQYLSILINTYQYLSIHITHIHVKSASFQHRMPQSHLAAHFASAAASLGTWGFP